MTEFTVLNHDSESTRIEDSRADAEGRVEMALTEFDFAESDLEIVQGAYESYTEATAADGGQQSVNSPEPTDPGGPEPAEVIEEDDPREAQMQAAAEGLPDRDVSDNPFDWMPGHFVDQIEGQPAINRQGYAVLSEFYDISVVSDVVVGPEETDFTFARCEATATDADGREYRAHGSAHVDRGDSETLLLEMADTRATKRALAMATGVGAVSVSELKNELDQ